MKNFVLIKIIEAMIALWVITLIVFGLTHLSGNPAGALLPDDATQEQIDFLIQRLGLDQPLHIQYIKFLGGALQGDFGMSMKWPGEPAMGVVFDRLPATLLLGGVAMFISIVIAIPLGVMSAVHKGKTIDSVAQGIALIGQSMPSFWLGILLIWAFAVGLKWLPTSGSGTFMHLILPAISIAWFQISALTRLTRSSMLEVLDAEYIKLARAKGVSEPMITWKHALSNAAIVPLTYFGVLAGSVLTGSVVIETVFSWPGLGWTAIEAIKARDFPVVQSVVVVFAIIFILANLLVDLLYAYVDPRIR
ncbi:ABC transporter permease [Paracoccus saliphilus]|uniref:ABC transporter permease n=1 Tax=Paracoccus saliphilus TaxID=405559 RepID=A0AA45W7U0_9RHOB|nr:ABC transporter permease [Paracoccus saliphilus]WCR01566.1 ABC transporter permease [Paracoccus saliphilus]SIT12358.1 peptide/nickel transport system permease protein [Paracoccus saliphilus]